VFPVRGRRALPLPTKAEAFREPKKKVMLPRADVSLLMSGTLVLDQKARDAPARVLEQFGQLLELGGPADLAATP
jgi:hypothetical protein